MTTESNPTFQIEVDEGYAITFHSLSRHKTISLEGIALLVYLLSHDQQNYKIKMKTVINHFQGRCGRRKLYSLVNELIAEGYIQRTFMKHGNLKREALYRVASKPKFKKSFRNGSFGDPETGDLQNGNVEEEQVSIDKSIDIKEDQCKERSPQAPTSAEADSLCTLLFEKIKEHLPGFKPPNLKNWRVEMDRMLRLDSRAFEQAKEVIEWLQEDKWFKANILSPKSLRNNFDRILAKMQMFKSENIVRRNRDFALKMRAKYPEKMKALTFDAKFVSNKFNAKDLPWNLPEETFRRELAALFNASGSQG
jgi:uncharacterized protein YdaT